MAVLPSQKGLNLSGKMKILDLLKGDISSSEVGLYYGKNELSICLIQDKEHEIIASSS
jgi:hypothetical protein